MTGTAKKSPGSAADRRAPKLPAIRDTETHLPKHRSRKCAQSVTIMPSRTFGQAVALLVLARILSGGLRGRGSHGWRSRMHRRWQEMTPEEREQVSARMPCGMTPRHHETVPPAPQS
jgi:hypothetical protein